MNSMDLRRRNAGTLNIDAGAAGLLPLGDASAAKVPPLTRMLSIAFRRKWIIVGAVLASLLAGLVITLLMTPQYTASTTLDIQREGGSFIQVEGAATQDMRSDQEFYETQYGLLKARSLAENVATNLKLFDNYQFFEMFNADQAEELFENGRPKSGAAARQERIREAGAILLEHVEVAPEQRSRLVEIRFTSPEPVLSKQVVDAWAEGFIQSTLERRFDATAYARKFLEERLTQLRARIDQSEKMLVNYAAREGIVNIPEAAPATGEGANGERPLVADDLAMLNREHNEAIARRIEAQSRLGADGGQVNEALQNPAIATLRQERAELAADYARLMTQFEPAYPPALALSNQIKQLDRSIATEEARVEKTLNQTYQASLAREIELQQKVNALKGDVLDHRRRSIQYNIYQREADTNRQLYDALLQRYKEIGVAGGVGVNNISIVDVAEVPQGPSSPKLIINLLMALIAGLGIGAAVAFALEQMDQGMRDPMEVERELGVPLLGTIPKLSGGDPAQALEDPKSAMSEAYQSLQTSLGFSTDHGVPKTLAVTSTRPAEGKSTTAFALAKSIARSRGRVLLVDADMRSPSVHHVFGLDNEKGLSNYLAGGDDLADLVRPTQYPGLFVMTSGPQPPSAPELLASDRIRQLVAKLGDEFGHVIFDAPPVMGLADAPLIGHSVEGTIFVVEANGTHKRMAQMAIGRLKDAEAQVLGAVLSKFDARRAHLGYGYNYGYGYEYGSEQTNKSTTTG